MRLLLMKLMQNGLDLCYTNRRQCRSSFGVLLAVIDRLKLTHQQQLDFLFTAGAFGLVIANNASISGAEGGCQAEVGSASAMASAALVAASGGTPDQSAQAVAITIKI